MAANYSESKEEKYIPNELSSSDMIVYEDEVEKEFMEHEMIKVEIVNDPDFVMSEWIDEDKEEAPKLRRVASLPPPKASRSSISSMPLDSADDQRIRERANMYCEICHFLLDSLRDAKAHYKTAHGLEGYIVCCERKFKQRCRLVEHVNTHFNFTYVCHICKKSFDSKSYLAKHQACHDINKQYVS